MAKAAVEKAPEKTPEKAPASEGKKKGSSIRPLTDAEMAELEKDDAPPEGYSNTILNDALPEEAVKEPEVEAEEEEKPAEEAKKTETAEPEKSATEKPAAAPAPTGDSFEKLERELAKPEGKEDLSAFSAREKAYFHQMRRDRKARQRAEEERDQALFRERKSKEDAAKPPAKDPFEGKADDDILTVADAKELLKKQPQTEPTAEAAPTTPHATQQRYLLMCENEARNAHPNDFDAVMELSEELLSGDKEALKELSEKTRAGENPAEVMYGLIKQHRDFETLLPAAEVRAKARLEAKGKKDSPASPPSASAVTPTPEDKAKEDKAKQTEKALEENARKTKTTAHVSSREGKPAEELTLDEISTMSDMEFAKLPRSVRQRYLKKYGA